MPARNQDSFVRSRENYPDLPNIALVGVSTGAGRLKKTFIAGRLLTLEPVRVSRSGCRSNCGGVLIPPGGGRKPRTYSPISGVHVAPHPAKRDICRVLPLESRRRYVGPRRASTKTIRLFLRHDAPDIPRSDFRFDWRSPSRCRALPNARGRTAEPIDQRGGTRARRDVKVPVTR